MGSGFCITYGVFLLTPSVSFSNSARLLCDILRQKGFLLSVGGCYFLPHYMLIGDLIGWNNRWMDVCMLGQGVFFWFGTLTFLAVLGLLSRKALSYLIKKTLSIDVLWPACSDSLRVIY